MQSLQPRFRHGSAVTRTNADGSGAILGLATCRMCRVRELAECPSGPLDLPSRKKKLPRLLRQSSSHSGVSADHRKAPGVSWEGSLTRHPHDMFQPSQPPPKPHDWQAVHAAMQQELHLIGEAMDVLRDPLMSRPLPLPGPMPQAASSPLHTNDPAVDAVAAASVAMAVASAQPPEEEGISSHPTQSTASTSGSSPSTSDTSSGPQPAALPHLLGEPSQPNMTEQPLAMASRHKGHKGPRQAAAKQPAAFTLAAAAAAAAACMMLGACLASPPVASALAKLPAVITSVVVASGTIAAAAGCAVGLAASGAALLIISTEAVVRAAGGSKGSAGMPVAPSFKDVAAAILSLCRGKPTSQQQAQQQHRSGRPGPGSSPAAAEHTSAGHDQNLQWLWNRLSEEVHLPEHLLRDLDVVRKQAAEKMAQHLKARGMKTPPEPEHGPSVPRPVQ